MYWDQCVGVCGALRFSQFHGRASPPPWWDQASAKQSGWRRSARRSEWWWGWLWRYAFLVGFVVGFMVGFMVGYFVGFLVRFAVRFIEGAPHRLESDRTLRSAFRIPHSGGVAGSVTMRVIAQARGTA